MNKDVSFLVEFVTLMCVGHREFRKIICIALNDVQWLKSISRDLLILLSS